MVYKTDSYNLAGIQNDTENGCPFDYNIKNKTRQEFYPDNN
jgi:hypothetical protein